jgi:hypothetical protein
MTEQQLAQHMLAHRSKGYSLAYVLRKSAVRYAIHVGLVVLLAIWFCYTDELWYKGLCLWGIGMFLGAVLRDFGWLRRIKRQWPFTEKIINWKTVEDMAEEKGPANKPDARDGV